MSIASLENTGYTEENAALSQMMKPYHPRAQSFGYHIFMYLPNFQHLSSADGLPSIKIIPISLNNEKPVTYLAS